MGKCTELSLVLVSAIVKCRMTKFPKWLYGVKQEIFVYTPGYIYYENLTRVQLFNTRMKDDHEGDMEDLAAFEAVMFIAPTVWEAATGK